MAKFGKIIRHADIVIHLKTILEPRQFPRSSTGNYRFGTFWTRHFCHIADGRREVGMLPGSSHDEQRTLPGDLPSRSFDERSGGQLATARHQGYRYDWRIIGG